MTLTLELPPSLARWLEEEAQQSGKAAGEIVVEALEQYAHTEGETFNITESETWKLSGSLTILDPDPKYIVGRDEQGNVITNFAEHVDDVLYGKV